MGITDDGEGKRGRKEMASSSADGMGGGSRRSEVDDQVGRTLYVGSSNMTSRL